MKYFLFLSTAALTAVTTAKPLPFKSRQAAEPTATPCHDLLNALEYLGEVQGFLQGQLIIGFPTAELRTTSRAIYDGMEVVVQELKTLRQSSACAAELASGVNVGEQAPGEVPKVSYLLLPCYR